MERRHCYALYNLQIISINYTRKHIKGTICKWYHTCQMISTKARPGQSGWIVKVGASGTRRERDANCKYIYTHSSGQNHGIKRVFWIADCTIGSQIQQGVRVCRIVCRKHGECWQHCTKSAAACDQEDRWKTCFIRMAVLWQITLTRNIIWTNLGIYQMTQVSQKP